MLRQRLAILQIRRPRDGGSPHRQPISPSSPYVGARPIWTGRRGGRASRPVCWPGASRTSLVQAAKRANLVTTVRWSQNGRHRVPEQASQISTEPNIRHRGITSHTNHTRTARPGTFNPPEYRVVTSAKVPWAVTSARFRHGYGFCEYWPPIPQGAYPRCED